MGNDAAILLMIYLIKKLLLLNNRAKHIQSSWLNRLQMSFDQIIAREKWQEIPNYKSHAYLRYWVTNSFFNLFFSGRGRSRNIMFPSEIKVQPKWSQCLEEVPSISNNTREAFVYIQNTQPNRLDEPNQLWFMLLGYNV